MPANKLFEKLRSGQVVLGVGNMYPGAGIIEGMAKGYDFVWIDGQHGQMSYHDLLNGVRVADAMGVSSLVRPPGKEPGLLGQIADMGTHAIMIPMVNTPQEARDIVKALRFAPLGQRSFGGSRVVDLVGPEYYRELELLVLAQVETCESVQNVSEIIETEGIDMLFFGPADMRIQLGAPINQPIIENPEILKAMEAIAKAASQAGKFCGTLAGNPAAIKLSLDMRYLMIAGGFDVTFLPTGANQRLQEMRAILDGKEVPQAGKQDVY